MAGSKATITGYTEDTAGRHGNNLFVSLLQAQPSPLLAHFKVEGDEEGKINEWLQSSVKVGGNVCKALVANTSRHNMCPIRALKAKRAINRACLQLLMWSKANTGCLLTRLQPLAMTVQLSGWNASPWCILCHHEGVHSYKSLPWQWCIGNFVQLHDGQTWRLKVLASLHEKGHSVKKQSCPANRCMTTSLSRKAQYFK